MSVRRPRARRPRRRRDPQRGGRRLHHRRRPRRAARSRSRTASSCARSSASAIGWSPTKPPRLAYIQRGGRLHPLPAASVLGIPTRIGPFLAHAAVLLAGQAAHGRGAVRAARAATTRDESIGAFMTRRFGARSDDLPRRAAAGRHPRRRRRSAVGAARCFRASSRPKRTHGSLLRAFRSASRASAPSARRRVSIAARRPERDGARAGRRAAGRTRSGSNAGVARDRRNGGRVPRRDRRPASRSTRAPSSSRRRRTSTGALVARSDAELARLCGEIPYASTATVALAFRARRDRASAERLRLRRAARRSAPASSRRRGCRRSGRTARRTIACCCARSSAARAIRDALERSDARARRAVARRARRRCSASAASRCSRASTAGSAPARSTRSATSTRMARDRARAGARIPAVRHRQRLPRRRAFPTASPTAARPRSRWPTWLGAARLDAEQSESRTIDDRDARCARACF